VVGSIDDAAIKTHKFIQPFRKILNTALPLVETPALDQVRNTLAAEFPYAIDVIDFALVDLIGRPTAHFRPLLLVGDPGAGKSHFARRLGEVLGLTIWRTDAAQSDGNSFAGTDRRWHSAEPCHPLLAIARGGNANPMILIDEIEKAGTRSDYGRLWDCLLGLLEPETSARYPDPALQIPLDLSHVSYVATANTPDPIPSPLRDRFRIISFPKPTLDDLDALLPGLIESLAADRGLDRRWTAPVDTDERAVIARAWRGGSVRRLRRILEATLRTRDQSARRH
jgi:ATP-dependent Lon protease